MIWKIRDTSYYAHSADFAIEIIETNATFPDLKIQTSASSFEVVFDSEKQNQSYDDDRKVRFSSSDDDEYFTILNREDITLEERKAIWFGKKELKLMRKQHESGDIDETYSQMEEPPQNDQLQEALHQLMAVSVVLDEQARQRREQLIDPESIAQKYSKFVQRSRQSMFISNLARNEGKRHKPPRPLQIITDGPVFTDVSKL